MGRVPIPVVVLVGLLPCCDGCGKHETTQADAATVEPPVPAPANLVAEGVIPTPDSTWSRVQRGVGGILAIMAPTVGGLSASLAGAEPWLGAEIDGGSPAYGVAGGTPVSLVVALRIRSAAHARETLAGDGGRFRAAGEKDGLAFFEPAASGFALGIAASGWIVMGTTKDAVAALGPYAYRTMPTKPLPKANIHFDFTHDGFAGWLVPLVQTKWTATKTFLDAKDTEARTAHGGREPDFGDAHAIVSILDGWVTPRVDAASDMKSGALDLDVRDDRIAGTLGLEPGAGASKTMMDAMRPGPMAIGAMPRARVVFAMRDDLAGRKETAKATSDGIQKILGKRLSAGDAKQVETTFDAFAAARGDWLVAASLREDAVFFRAPAGNPAAANAATRDLVGLVDKPALAKPVAAITGGAKLPIAWSVKDSAIRICVGGAPAELDAPTDDRYAKAVDALGEASLVVAGHAEDADPISTLATKRKDGRIEIVLDATPVIVRNVLKALMAL